VFELLGAGRTPPIVSQPPNTLSNYVLGGQLYTVYIRFTSLFWSGSNHRKVQPPSQFFTIQTLSKSSYFVIAFSCCWSCVFTGSYSLAHVYHVSWKICRTRKIFRQQLSRVGIVGVNWPSHSVTTRTV